MGSPALDTRTHERLRREGTEAVLDALAVDNQRATFFVLLSRVRHHKTVLAEAQSAGHEIALHGTDHRRLPVPGEQPHELAERLRSARQELEDVLGEPVSWFRPPYGAQTNETWAATRRAGLTPVLWSRTCHDWQHDLTTTERLRELRDVRPGAIILAHDGFATAADGAHDGPPPLLDRGSLTQALLKRLRAQRLTSTTLTLMLCNGDPGTRVWLDQPNLTTTDTT